MVGDPSPTPEPEAEEIADAVVRKIKSAGAGIPAAL
jgi:hypothetical protein